MRFDTSFMCVVLVAATAAAAGADIVTIGPIKDNTLFEAGTNDLSNGAGQYLFAGRTALGLDFELRRGLLAFDIAGSLPAGSTINSVTLTLYMSRTRAGATTVSLHRALADWGEAGSQAAGNEGAGAPAHIGDVTWRHTFFDTDFWQSVGGDYDANASASTSVSGTGFYSWSSATLAADVAGWLGNPSGNFGWVIAGNEAVTRTAKRFNSRENNNSSQRPMLTIDFTPPSSTGACCFVDGSCLVLTSEGCSGQGGVYQGDGTGCAPNLCPQPPGACCLNDGTCTIVLEPDCDTAGGTFQGNPSCDPSPCVVVLEPFVDPLPIPSVLQPVSGEVGGEATYEINIVEFDQQLHRDLPPTRLWGYEGSFPGPTIEAGSDLPVTVDWINDLRDEQGVLRTEHYLPVDPCPHGAAVNDPRVVTHLHGAHVAPEFDGQPEATFLPGERDTYVYPNDQFPATLWYHDHALGITRLNVYMGLAGFYIIRDDVESNLNLPSGAHEIPLVIQDRSFNIDGTLAYPAQWEEVFFGDFMLVNGKVWPSLDVERGKYRFRVLNGCNSRTLTLSLSNLAPFFQIGSDGGLLPTPVVLTEVTLAPAERADLVIDFAPYPGGTVIVLRNTASAPFPGDPGAGVIPDAMRFVVQNVPGDQDPLPPTLRAVDPLLEQDAVEYRDFVIQRASDPCAGTKWLINGLGWNDIVEFPRLDTVEVWRFINRSGMMHPMHMHLVQYQVLDRQDFIVIGEDIIPVGDPIAPDPNEAGWKDTVRANPDQITRVIARFDGWLGTYPYHCHIIEHEDHEMMRQFQVVASETICPDDPNDFLRQFGGPVSGDALDLCASDDVRLEVRQRARVSPALPFVRLEYWAHASIADNPVVSVDYHVEAHVSAVVPGGQHPDTLRTSIRNYTDGLFELIDIRGTASGADEIITHTQVTKPPDYVQGGDGEVRVRQDVFDPGTVFSLSWFLKVDAYEVTINK